MASRTPTPRSRSRSTSASSDSSDTTMLDAPLTPAPAQPRRPSINPTASMHDSKKDAAFSLLLSLPRELRDRVYVYALTSPYPFSYPAPSPLAIRHDLALGLLTTSKRVYEEAAPILYSCNKFLFTHPSDCNIFRVVASPKYSALITAVYFRIRDKDLRIWTAYLGSTMKERSLKEDLPRLRALWIFLRCGTIGVPHIAHLHAPGGLAAMHGVQHVLGQQVAALQQQVQNLANAMAITVNGGPGLGLANINGNANVQQTGNANGTDTGANTAAAAAAAGAPPPPTPGLGPAQAMPFPAFAQGGFGQHQQHAHHHHHQHNPPLGQLHLVAHPTPQQTPNPAPLYASFLRWERELGLENLCLSLQDTRPAHADVKIVCILRLPKMELGRLTRLYPDELAVDRNGDARTKFRRVHGVEVSLELTGFEVGTG